VARIASGFPFPYLSAGCGTPPFLARLAHAYSFHYIAYQVKRAWPQSSKISRICAASSRHTSGSNPPRGTCALAALPLPDDQRASLRAATHNTAVPTILRGGHRINVIPSAVSVDVDGRILPGQAPDEWVRQVQQAVGDEVEVTLLEGEHGIAADPASPFFDTIAATMRDADPGSALLPYLVTGGTDARAFPGIKVYGFMPTRHDTRVGNLAHGHDERTSIDDLLFATRCLYDVVTRFCVS